MHAREQDPEAKRRLAMLNDILGERKQHKSFSSSAVPAPPQAESFARFDFHGISLHVAHPSFLSSRDLILARRVISGGQAFAETALMRLTNPNA